MAHTVTSKLNQNAKMHPLNSGDAMFFVSLSEKVYNRDTKQNEWTNYDAALYAKQGQIQYYQSALIEGSVVSVTGKTAKVDIYQKRDGNHGAKIVLNDCSLDFVHSESNVSAPQQAPMQQQAQPQDPWGKQPPQQAPMQHANMQQAPVPQQRSQANGGAGYQPMQPGMVPQQNTDQDIQF